MSALAILGKVAQVGKTLLQNRYEDKQPQTKVGKFLSGVVGTPTAMGATQFQQNQIAVNSMLGGTSVSLAPNIDNTITPKEKPMEKIQTFIKEKPLQALAFLGLVSFAIYKFFNKRKGGRR